MNGRYEESAIMWHRHSCLYPIFAFLRVSAPRVDSASFDLPLLPLCSFVTLVVNNLGFSDHGDLLQPSACVPQPDTHPPYRWFVENKRQSAFDRAVDRTVEALSYRFCQPNRFHFAGLFCPCNPLPTVRSAVGRRSEVLRLIAEC